MRRSVILAVSALLALSSTACMGGMAEQAAPDPAVYATVLAEPSRPAEDRGFRPDRAR